MISDLVGHGGKAAGKIVVGGKVDIADVEGLIGTAARAERYFVGDDTGFEGDAVHFKTAGEVIVISIGGDYAGDHGAVGDSIIGSWGAGAVITAGIW